MQQLDSVRDVLVEQVADLQSSEQQLVSALSQMADAAFNHRLREAFQTHLEQTRTQQWDDTQGTPRRSADAGGQHAWNRHAQPRVPGHEGADRGGQGRDRGDR